MYRMDLETGFIHSPGRHGKPLIKKVRMQALRTGPSLVVNLIQDGKWRVVSYYRLRYAVEHDICYDDMPQDFKVVMREGALSVVDNRMLMEQCKSYMASTRRRERLKRIDGKIHELEIMRRAYTEGSHKEAAAYIESRKQLLVCQFQKRFRVRKQTAEDVYALAFEKIIERIDSEDSLVTELTVSMMGYMNKVYRKLHKESPLYLKSENASNSHPNHEP